MPTKELNREAWLALHGKSEVVTASQLSSVLGINPYKSPFALYQEKVGAIEPDPENTAMRIGKALEPLVAQMYTEETGRNVVDLGEYTIHHREDFPLLVATLDRWDTDEQCPVEMKTSMNPSAQALDEWEAGGPFAYQVQVQAQLFLTETEVAYLAGLLGRQFRVVEIHRNEKFINWMKVEVQKFVDCVLTKTPPAMDASESTVAAVKRLYPKDDGTVALRPDLAQTVSEYLAAKDSMSAAEARVKELQGRLITEIGPHSSMSCDGYTVTYKHQKRKGYFMPDAEFRVLKVK